jgi:hypothetical protein
MANCLQEGFPHYLFHVFPVMHEILSDAKEPTVVSLDNLFEGSSITILAGID